MADKPVDGTVAMPNIPVHLTMDKENQMKDILINTLAFIASCAAIGGPFFYYLITMKP